MKVFIVSFLVGGLFSAGLTLSGMINPKKVIGFLDLFGSWDPALIFVMGGAVGLNLVLFKFILRRKKPIMIDSFSLPQIKSVDKKLIIGSILFGIGWGLVGICPGPGIVNLVQLDLKFSLFVLSMFVGFIFEFKFLRK